MRNFQSEIRRLKEEVEALKSNEMRAVQKANNLAVEVSNLRSNARELHDLTFDYLLVATITVPPRGNVLDEYGCSKDGDPLTGAEIATLRAEVAALKRSLAKLRRESFRVLVATHSAAQQHARRGLMPREIEYDTFQARCVGETDKALCVMLGSSREEHWVPKSLLHPEDNEVQAHGDEGELVVVLWWAEKNLK